jgi:hypothetical protein
MKFPLWQSVVLVGVSLCASCGLHAYSASEGMLAAPSSERLGAPPADEAKPAAAAAEEVTIPGPLRSFLRMAGISQKVSQEEVLPLLARNISAEGYEGTRPTEFLILLRRYVDQARELADLAGPSRVIRVANCQDATPLLRILGYRLRQVCGDKNTSLVTANPEKAFLTIDSGFPLPELEEALQHDSPFTYEFPASRVPVLFTEKDECEQRR